MKIGTMRIVDTWVGTPLCFMATLLSKILPRKRPNPTPKRALFIELSEMGSAVICAAALRRFQENHPDTEIHFLIFQPNREGIEIVGLIEPERIHTIKHDNLFQIAAGVFQLFFLFRRLKFDVVIDLELFSCFTAILSWLTAAPVKSGFCSTTTAGLYRGDFLTHKVSFNSNVHIVYNYLALVEALIRPEEYPSFKGTLDHLKVEPPTSERHEGREARFRSLLTEQWSGLDHERHRLILINPDPGLLAIRGWGYDRFAELAKRILAAEPEAVIVLTGLQRSRSDCARMKEQIGSERCINFAGFDEGLTDLLSLFFLGDLLITNDSGPAHFATLSQIPTVTLYGPASPVTYGVLNPNAKSLTSEYHCSPCLTAHNRRSTACDDNQCLQAIGVETVLEHSLSLLSRTSG